MWQQDFLKVTSETPSSHSSIQVIPAFIPLMGLFDNEIFAQHSPFSKSGNVACEFQVGAVEN